MKPTRPLASLVALSLAIIVVTSPLSARAQAGRLWSERTNGAPPIAQVPDFSALAKALSPAVVSIQVEQRVRTGRGPQSGGPPGADEFFRRFFGGEMPREYKNRGIGSGFVIRSDGLIVTNNHVVEDADEILVTFQLDDGSEKKLPAKVLGTAPEYDVALIQTTSDAKATVAYLGDSDRTNIGDWVMAVGNPFGLSHSVSVGIISAKGRRDIAPSGRTGLYDFMQTDASINPGNSGGPLINMKGEVIGINSAINAAGAGIGFAIPINMVKNMLPDLQTKGRYSRSWIGIKIQPIDDQLAASFGLDRTRGALVAEVVHGSPAADGGVREGDVILQFDGKDLRQSSDLPLLASLAGVGKRVPLKLWRDKKERTVFVTLTEFKSDEVAMRRGQGAEKDADALGLVVSDITPDLQQRLRLETPRGIVVTDIEEGGIAAEAGIEPGDVIVRMNGADVTSARQFADNVKKLKKGDYLQLLIGRQGTRLFVAFRKP